MYPKLNGLMFVFVPESGSTDNAAGDFYPGIPGGLGGEIIRMGMDDDGTSDNIPDLEPLIVKGRPCIALIG